MPSYSVCEDCVHGHHGRCRPDDGCACRACWGEPDDQPDDTEGDGQ